MLNTNDILKQLKLKEDLCHCVCAKRLSFLQDFRVRHVQWFSLQKTPNKKEIICIVNICFIFKIHQKYSLYNLIVA